MTARLFIIIVGPPVLVVAFFSEVIIGFRSAFRAVGIELACMKRDWKAGELTPEKDID
ncbi:hypothetical protein [Ensifer sp. LBL]|uniref:hypothetical protein n=1 Tax=Ensifer sp. LBL TaxID=2991056 RepID=UPI003D1E047E